MMEYITQQSALFAHREPVTWPDCQCAKPILHRNAACDALPLCQTKMAKNAAVGRGGIQQANAG